MTKDYDFKYSLPPIVKLPDYRKPKQLELFELPLFDKRAQGRPPR